MEYYIHYKVIFIKETTQKEEIAWDLTEIFPDIKDPKITEVMEDLGKRANAIVESFKGKIVSPNFSPEKLKELFQTQEDFVADLFELELYSSLSFSANMTLDETQELFNKVNDFNTEINKKLAFMELEIGKLVDQNPEFISKSVLSNYKHHLERIKRAFPHKLSEIEEQIILEKDQFGVDAWSELQSKWLNTRMIEVEVAGEKKSLPYGEADGLIKHPDRKTRTSANKSIYGLLGKENEIFSSALRNICGNWVKNSKRRKFDNPMGDSLISNDIDKNTIDNLMKVIENNVGVYQKYLKIKAKLMNLPKLGCEDVQAPLQISNKTEKESKYDWKTAKKIALEAYTKFDKEFADIVSDMINRNHIDASPRYGKRNGAFCAGWYKGKSAFILQTFTGSLNDIYTLTHELGHACHDYLSSPKQTILNLNIAHIVAEVASIFGELLLTDLMLENATDKEEKICILSHVLDDAGMAIFQVSARVFFEQGLYKAIEKKEFLSGERISELWCAGRDKIYGESVDWFEEMNWEWCMKPHYFMANYRFYNYPYVYANLFVYALYQIYLNEGSEFVPKLKKMLSVGSSISPKQIGEIIGLDITEPKFWELGMKQYEKFTSELEKLVE